MTTSNTQRALTVLGDPTRRAIFERLASGPLAVGALADGLPVSRSAVSQHLAALKEVGLVTNSIEGSRHVYEIDPAALGELRKWLDQFWAVGLERLQSDIEDKSWP